MDEFFPGSRLPLTPPAGLPDSVRIPEGKKFTIGGREVELYSIGDVARLLNRQTVTLRKWENNGTIPKATYAKSGRDPRGRRRLYSRPQVEALVRIAQEEKILNDPHKQISKTQFTAKVYAAFRELIGK